MEEYKSKVYIKLNERNLVLRVEGGYTMSNIDNIDEWTYIDEGNGDRYNLCQSNYLDGPIYDEHGIPRYKYVNGEIVPRTNEEILADIPPVVPVATQLDRIEAQAMFTALMTDTLLEA